MLLFNGEFFKSLYWKITAMLFLLFVLVGCVYFYLAVYTARIYFQEANQRLNSSIAKHIATHTKPFLNGQLNNTEVEALFYNTMLVNPAIEIYLLDKEGTILSFYAPNKTVKLKRISLLPIEEFIKTNGNTCIKGEDPKSPGKPNVFSAAPVTENGLVTGFIYVVLSGEEYNSIISLMLGTFLMRLGAFSMVLTLAGVFAISLGIIWMLTRTQRHIINTVKRFSNGDMNARIHLSNRGEFANLVDTFNQMADTVSADIDNMKKLDKLRVELIANVSHDLRTPLAVVNGYVETLQLKFNELTDEEKYHYMNVALKNLNKLGKLVSDLFEVTKLETMQIAPQKEQFFVEELVSDVISKYNLLSIQKDILISHEMTENLPLVYADISMIDRVLQNLVDNAIKFTLSKGRILIKLFREKSNVMVSISDTGSGMSGEELTYIFNRYHRKNRKHFNSEGSGLGLIIVNKILEMHGTSISIESEKGKGSVFTFALEVLPS